MKPHTIIPPGIQYAVHANLCILNGKKISICICKLIRLLEDVTYKNFDFKDTAQFETAQF